jgi:hypothetical protein
MVLVARVARVEFAEMHDIVIPEKKGPVLFRMALFSGQLISL